MDPHAAMYRRLALAGIAAQSLLVACAWLLPLGSRFGLLEDGISELALGHNGWIMVIALALGSLGAIAIALAVRGLTRGTPGSKPGAVLLGIYGAAGVIAALFPTEEAAPGGDVWAQSLTGRIHLLAAAAALLAAVAGLVVLAWTLNRDPRWRVLTPWPVLFATAAFSLLLAQSTGLWAGLLQRLLVSVVAALLVLVAARAVWLATGILERIRAVAHADSEVLAEIAAELDHPVRH